MFLKLLKQDTNSIYLINEVIDMTKDPFDILKEKIRNFWTLLTI